MPERATHRVRWSEESAEAVVAEGELEAKGRTWRKVKRALVSDVAMPQKSRQLELPFESWGEASAHKGSVEATLATRGSGHLGSADLMEQVVSRPNLQAALKRVRKNKGSPGIDGMTVGALPAFLIAHWTRIREELLTGMYRPAAIKRVEIPKSGGGVRELGIPTVLDRFIQQALLQVLQPEFDPSFSTHSYGFRPGRSAHAAVKAARAYVQSGRRYVVDMDLEKFFDRVNHDVLMSRLARRIGDRRVLGLIRRYLGAGVMAQGVLMDRYEGTPQGGPLSPLLANALLDEVDKELERRGHAFVRYADDCNVYVRSRRAGERVMALLRRLVTRLHLRVNETKSAVDLARNRKILGYTFWYTLGGTVTKLKVADKALETLKERVRRITRRTGGRSMEQVVAELRDYLPGWRAYFSLSEAQGVFGNLDKWIRHRLRAIHLRQWRRGKTVFRELRRRDACVQLAANVAKNTRRWWKNSAMDLNVVLPVRYFDQLGVPRLRSVTSTP
jgi:group II intron reverse transcriptase/maturase